MYNRFALGIDGGASKVLTQLFTINKNNEIIDQSEPFEQIYKDVDTFNHQFIPVPLNTQNEEMNNENYKIGFNEKGQSKVIIKAIIESIKYFNYKNISFIGFCFPGLKTENLDGVSVMANGPRNLEMLNDINKKIASELGPFVKINKIYDDSLSCVLGEKFSHDGKLKNCSNAIYIGGGTGIADGILFNDRILDLKIEPQIKKSWQIKMENGDSIEECFSLSGLCKKWNDKKPKSIELLNDLFNKAIKKDRIAMQILEDAGKAFHLLIKSRIKFFEFEGKYPEKIVIGQRMGQILNEKNHPLKSVINKYNVKDIPLELSLNRNTAALGAAQSAIHEGNVK